jgi:hypothetical protein
MVNLYIIKLTDLINEISDKINRYEHILESVLDKIKKIKIMEREFILYMDSLEILIRIY